MRIRIGLTQTNHDVEAVVDDAEAFMQEVESALDGGKPMLWVTDPDGHKYGIAVARIAYVHLEAEKERIVGFG